MHTFFFYSAVIVKAEHGSTAAPTSSTAPSPAHAPGPQRRAGRPELPGHVRARQDGPDRQVALAAAEGRERRRQRLVPAVQAAAAVREAPAGRERRRKRRQPAQRRGRRQPGRDRLGRLRVWRGGVQRRVPPSQCCQRRAWWLCF